MKMLSHSSLRQESCHYTSKNTPPDKHFKNEPSRNLNAWPISDNGISDTYNHSPINLPQLSHKRYTDTACFLLLPTAALLKKFHHIFHCCSWILLNEWKKEYKTTWKTPFFAFTLFISSPKRNHKDSTRVLFWLHAVRANTNLHVKKQQEEPLILCKWLDSFTIYFSVAFKQVLKHKNDCVCYKGVKKIKNLTIHKNVL